MSVEIKLRSGCDVTLVQMMGGDHTVVASAKVSTCGEEALKFAVPESGESNAGLINYLIKHGHGTPTEQSAMTFFVNAPIAVWREHVKHRIGVSMNEVSGRYSKLQPVFYIPPQDRNMIPVEGYKAARPKFGPATERQWQGVCSELSGAYYAAYQAYSNMIDAGIANEVARYCLPVGIYSQCWITMNPRSLMHFLSLRTHEPTAGRVSWPMYEIEQVARKYEAVFAQYWPITYKAFNDNGRVAP